MARSSDPDREIEHGRRSNYILNVCRCPTCTQANTSYCVDRKTWLRTRGPLVPGWRDQLRQEQAS